MKKFKCIIADDYLLNRFLLENLLDDYSEIIYTAKDGEQCINILKEKEIDIIFMDINMPKMNGIEATKFIRNSMSDPKNNVIIVAFTSFSENELFDDFKLEGFDYWLQKPISAYKINEMMKSIVPSYAEVK